MLPGTKPLHLSVNTRWNSERSVIRKPKQKQEGFWHMLFMRKYTALCERKCGFINSTTVLPLWTKIKLFCYNPERATRSIQNEGPSVGCTSLLDYYKRKAHELVDETCVLLCCSADASRSIRSFNPICAHLATSENDAAWRKLLSSDPTHSQLCLKLQTNPIELSASTERRSKLKKYKVSFNAVHSNSDGNDPEETRLLFLSWNVGSFELQI